VGDVVKILVVTTMYPSEDRPALGTFVRTQVESLRRAGVDVEVLALRGGRSKYLRGLLQLRRRLRRGDVDLVHAHYSYVGVLARMQRRVPVVVTFHGDDLLGTINARGRTTLLSRLVVRIGRALVGVVDAAIVQTERMAEGLPEARVFVLPHEVDTSLFRPLDPAQARAELGLDSAKRYVLFAASPEIPVKRFALAREAVELLRAEDLSVELLTVSEEPQPRLVQYMSACDALIFPSYQEGSPNIIKQAMACNLPIVATDVGDVREVIGSTRGCAVVEPDAARLARHLRELVIRPRRTDGRTRISRFEPEQVTARLVAVYESALERRRSVREGAGRSRLGVGLRGD
jgi:teichuronic acid biosynthesis glycosyltransferase TuaC